MADFSLVFQYCGYYYPAYLQNEIWVEYSPWQKLPSPWVLPNGEITTIAPTKKHFVAIVDAVLARKAENRSACQGSGALGTSGQNSQDLSLHSGDCYCSQCCEAHLQSSQAEETLSFPTARLSLPKTPYSWMVWPSSPKDLACEWQERKLFLPFP